jgi:hypothetical protein
MLSSPPNLVWSSPWTKCLIVQTRYLRRCKFLTSLWMENMWRTGFVSAPCGKLRFSEAHWWTFGSFPSHPACCVFCVYKQTAKWVEYICRHRSSLWMSWAHLWCSRRECGFVWTISWQWSYLGFGNPEIQPAWRSVAQPYPLRFTCHVPCEAHILVWHLQGENQVSEFSVARKFGVLLH